MLMQLKFNLLGELLNDLMLKIKRLTNNTNQIIKKIILN